MVTTLNFPFRFLDFRVIRVIMLISKAVRNDSFFDCVFSFSSFVYATRLLASHVLLGFFSMGCRWLEQAETRPCLTCTVMQNRALFICLFLEESALFRA